MLSCFNVFWRLAILALPWQTRWFFDAQLGGWPWEQGRWSGYVSWSLMLVVICLGSFIFSRTSWLRGSEQRITRWFLVLIGGLACTSVLALIVTPDRRIVFPAIAQWWIQVLMLGAFIFTLRRARIPFFSLALWFVLALLPHIVLGFWQYAMQLVVPMKWLGIAAQDPRNLGVSVVEAGLFRVLRIYGGFPHPNLFGSWLAFSAILSLWLASHAMHARRAAFFSVLTALFSTALLLTFARGAWIAALVGVAALMIQLALRRRIAPVPFQYAIVAVVASVMLLGVVGFTQHQLLIARVQATERIEQKSLHTRIQSLKDGVMLFRAHPIFGTGPNAELVAMANIKKQEHKIWNLELKLQAPSSKLQAPLEPPHNTYLLFLVDFGLLGAAFAVYAILRGWSQLTRAMAARHWLMAPLLLLGLVDHALLSLWAGQTLVAMIILLFMADMQSNNQER